ncbi:MAG: NAD(P)H-binding protein [Bacteroidia bacterium]|nr:NAD(P)H-binding protein [Bacteroidia bacterium]
MNHEKTAIIAGASGQVGGYLLTKLLNSDEYQNVIALIRQPLEITHPKLQQLQVDFEQLNTLQIQGNDVFCCMGTTIKKAKTQENFKHIDYGYPLQLAKTMFQNGATKFMLVSSMGADTKSSIFYARVKGELEKDVAEIPYKTIGIFRPSMLLGPRKEKRMGEQIGKILMRFFAFIIPAKYKAVHAEKVAESMLQFAQKDLLGAHIILNPEILKVK